MTCHGVAECVVAGGRVVVENGNLVDVVQGGGRFVPTPPNAPFIYMKIQEREKVTNSALMTVECKQEDSSQLWGNCGCNGYVLTDIRKRLLREY